MEYIEIRSVKVGDIIMLRKGGAKFEVIGIGGRVISIQNISNGESRPIISYDYPKVYLIKEEYKTEAK